MREQTNLISPKTSHADVVDEMNKALGFSGVDSRDVAQQLTVRHVDAEHWDAVACQFSDLIQEQLQSYHDSHEEPRNLTRLALYDGNRLCAAALARKMKLPLLGTPIHMLRWGPLWHPLGQDADPALLPAIYKTIVSELAVKTGGLLLIQPRAHPEHGEAHQSALDACGFKPTEVPGAPERYFVNVDLPSEEVFKSLKQKWRYNLKKSRKAGLAATWDSTEAGFDVFYELYRQLVDRKQFFDFSPVEAVKTRLLTAPAHLKPKILIVRDENDTPVAAAVIDCLGERPVYLYGATSDAALPLRAGYFLQWEIAEYLCNQPETRWYELGGGNSPTCSLHQFKRGFAGSEGTTTNEPAIHWVAGNSLTRQLFPLALAARNLKQRVQVVKNWLNQKIQH